jgi:hypothetical protein
MMFVPTPIRVRRAPAVDGPYEEEPVEPARVQGSLALALPGLTQETPRIPLRLVPPARPVDAAGQPPPVRPTVARLAQAIAEVLAGCRNAAQLAEHTSHEVLCQLERSAGRLGTRDGRPTPAPRVTSVHVHEPAPRVAEACLVIDTGRRRRAVAVRVEAPGQRWRCTALQVG